MDSMYSITAFPCHDDANWTGSLKSADATAPLFQGWFAGGIKATRSRD
jgi:hypothetical protein